MNYWDENVNGTRIIKWVKNEIKYDDIYQDVQLIIDNFLKLNVRDKDLIQDIHQTIHIQVFEYKDKIDINKKTLPILTQIIKGKGNQYIQYYNERKNRNIEFDGIKNDIEDIEYDQITDNIFNRIDVLKNNFDDVKKNIFKLYFEDNFTVHKISKKYKIPTEFVEKTIDDIMYTILHHFKNENLFFDERFRKISEIRKLYYTIDNLNEEINLHKMQIKDIRSRYYIKLTKSKVKYTPQKQFKKNNNYI